jgi:hypothetical protein
MQDSSGDKLKFALFGDLSLEKAMDLSWDGQILGTWVVLRATLRLQPLKHISVSLAFLRATLTQYNSGNSDPSCNLCYVTLNAQNRLKRPICTTIQIHGGNLYICNP